MYAIFYCSAFTAPYQLCRFDLGFQTNSWHRTISSALLDLDFTTPSTDGIITNTAARIRRFESMHEHTKQLKLVAEAPSVEAFYHLYPELFL